MAKALLVHERTSEGEWRPVGIFYGTAKRLDSRFLPGDGSRDAWVANVLANSQPPFRDGVGISLERGTWEDWIEWANANLGNGHDTWVTLFADPDPTAEATYQRLVLDNPAPLVKPDIQPTDTVPTLSGYKKVRPA